MGAERVIRVHAPAKLNLTLRVLGRRPDGYHDLRTVFQSIALHDTVTIRTTRGPMSLDCGASPCPSDQTNLVWRAAEQMWRAAGRRGALRGIAVRLVKRIPMQAGLGGGSADAAAAVLGLARLWRVGEAAVRRVAAALGADVSFFLEGGTMLGLERGDLLFRLADLPPWWVTLVMPSFGVSTKDAYGWVDEAAMGACASAGGARPDRAGEWRNDFQPVVAARYPEIERMVKALRRRGAWHAAMSGSGSAVFGLFESRHQAEAAGRALVSSTQRTLVTRTLRRRAHGRLVGTATHQVNLPFAPRGLGHF